MESAESVSVHPSAPPGFLPPTHQGDAVVRRYFSANQSPGLYRADLSSSSPERPLLVDELRTREGVLGEFGLEDGSATVLVDAHGNEFERFESWPADYLDYPDGVLLRPAVTVLGHPRTSVVWVLDVWTDTSGSVNRLRLMTKDVFRFYAELRFEPNPEAWPEVTPPDALGCPTAFGESVAQWLGWEDYEQTLKIDLKVSLDTEGRPYELVIPEGVTTTVESLDRRLVVPDGELRVMDGSAVEVDPSYFADESVVLDFGKTLELNVSLVREVFEEWSPILGVRIQVPNTTVARWDPFEFGYGTDGGVGGVTTMSVITLAGALEDDEDGFNPIGRPITEGWDYETSDYFVGDLDSVPGPETIVFSNGYGDGAFPLTRGYDDKGDLVAVMIWDTRYPWRLAVPDGEPPADVTEREEQLIECMEGRREVLGDGSCHFDEE